MTGHKIHFNGEVYLLTFLILNTVIIMFFREDNSDADSGVPDLPPWSSRTESLNLSGMLVTLYDYDQLSHCILVESSIVICWRSPFVVLGVLGLFCRFYSIFDENPVSNVDPDQSPHYMHLILVVLSAYDLFMGFRVRMG